eukprot:jgi/Undpi1/9946/HiC_scaffold_28.g12400.m1
MGGAARDWLRLVLSKQAFLQRHVASALVFFSCHRWEGVGVGGSHIIALTLPQSDLSAGTASNESDGYFPLSKALTSVMRLAVDDINAAGVESLTLGNLTLSVVGVKTGTRAMEGLCEALESVGANGTFGVSGAF